MNPLQRYESDLQQPRFITDPLQREAVIHTHRLYEELNRQPVNKPGLFDRLLKRNQKPLRGLYFMGGTGRGKTYLMDCFYECLPFEQKHRIHYHRFMLEIHARLKELPRSPDPLQIIGGDLAQKYRVLCLDEFHVHDIGDAMIMAGLLKGMFNRGLTVVATSNIPIQDLYKNGFQRERFLPAIALLQEHLEEFDLEGGTDFRLNQLSRGNTYLLVETEEAEEMLEQRFTDIAPVTPKHHRSININQRDIPYLACADDVIWFDFNALCNTPRAASDYLEIAVQFHTLFLSHIPIMNEDQDAVTKRFIHLIDALYDHNVNLVLTAEVAPDQLYTGRRLAFAFQRTTSRLYEMTGREYLAKPHLC